MPSHNRAIVHVGHHLSANYSETIFPQLKRPFGILRRIERTSFHSVMTRCTDCLVVGHRGFKAKYTENTITGFTKCFETGATMFETDTWTTKDEVLVISHDVNTRRIFCDENGDETDFNILESYYDQLKNLRTIQSGELMLTFKGLLTWFVEYIKEYGEDDSEHKIMLDIKNANPPKILQLIIRDMLEVHDDLSWWFPRIQFGVWNLRFVKYLNQDPYFQKHFGMTKPRYGYNHPDILHISGSWQDSMTYLAYNEFLRASDNDRFKFYITGVSMIYISTWSKDFVTKFLPALKAQNLKLFTWTINNVAQLEYFCNLCQAAQIREYGIISDWPDKMVSYLSEIEEPKEKTEHSALVLARDFYVPWRLRIPNYLCMAIFSLSGVKIDSAPTAKFSSTVDPNEKVVLKATWFRKVFAFLQLRGIF